MLCACCALIFPDFRSRCSRLEEADYAALASDGLSAVLVYQETYDAAAYGRHHLRGPKADMAYRLATPDRLGRAGIKKIGLGALYGSATGGRTPGFLGLHLRYLEQRYWRTRYSVSFPRLRPHAGADIVVTPFGERDLVQTACALRLLSPEAELSLSTRESAAFRDRAFRLGFHRHERWFAHQSGGLCQRPRVAGAVCDRRPAHAGRGGGISAGAGLRARLEDWDPTYDGCARHTVSAS